VRVKTSNGIHDESTVAAATARRINSIHETVEIGVNTLEDVLDEFVCALDVPSGDGLNSFLISRAVGDRTKVVLSGLGGDELFGGYPVFQEAYRLAHPKTFDPILQLLPRSALYRLHIQHLQYWGKQVRELALDKRIVGIADDEVLSSARFAFNENEDLARAISQFEMSHYLRNTLLRDTDAVTLHNSLECRVPFVDKTVYETAMSAATDLKLRGIENKPLLVNAFRDMLPYDITRSPKRGFALPLVEWARQHLTPARTQELQQIALRHGLPLSDQALNGRKVGMSHYQWLILLKWIEKNENYLSSGVAQH
jgi:asparagine synthase (glutamine-hydrolysing)